MEATTPELRSRLPGDRTGDDSPESVIGQAADEFLQRLEAGERPDADEYAARFPQVANELRQVLAAMQVIRECVPADAAIAANEMPIETPGEPPSPSGGVLGDFLIVREIGRGGMGVVYEAEQISLARRVALKVLPYAGMLDDRRLQRFKNESRAAAGLHHQNIVPIHSVGCDRGVHFYAMQYIEGQTLAEVIAGLRAEAGMEEAARGKEGTETGNRDKPQVARSSARTVAAAIHDGPASPIPSVPVETQSLAARSTEPWPRDRQWYRTAAQIAVQTAEALEYAHSLGVVHRDIKPANLLIDSCSKVWITDFGLAQMENEAALTMSGDILGTLRYMSPEQARGEHRNLDHRADIYSLGATLYELLTLQPAFAAETRSALFRQVLEDDPPALRRRSPAIPHDLETIVLKAMAKEAPVRYATAQQMADDLNRFLRNEPISARRPTMVERAGKWVQRRRSAAMFLGAAAVAALLLTAAGALVYARAAQAAAAKRIELNQSLLETLTEVDRLREQRRSSTSSGDALGMQARDLARKAQYLAENDQATPELANRARRLNAQLDEEDRDQLFLDRIDEANQQQTELDTMTGALAERPALPLFASALAAWGIVVDETPVDQAAAKIQSRPQELPLRAITALDNSISLSLRLGETEAKTAWLKSLVQQTDNGDNASCRWRRSFRQARIANSADDLLSLAATISETAQPGYYWAALAKALCDIPGRRETGLALLRNAYRRFPSEPLVLLELMTVLREGPTVEQEERLTYAYAAAALRPKSAGALMELGATLGNLGRIAEAAEIFQRLVALAPESAIARDNLANVLADQGKFDAALEQHHRAIELKPERARSYFSLSKTLQQKGEVHAAIDAMKTAVVLRPDFYQAQSELGNLLRSQGDMQGAVAAYRRAIQANPDNHLVHAALAGAAEAQGDIETALREYQASVRLNPAFAPAHLRLAQIFAQSGDDDGAEAACREAIRLDPQNAQAHALLGCLLLRQGDLLGALSACFRDLELRPESKMSHGNIAHVFLRLRNGAWALQACQNALRLSPNDAPLHCEFAGALAVLPPDAGADPIEVVRIAERAVELAPKEIAVWNTMGLAYFRAGRMQDCIDALNRGMQLSGGGDAYDWRLLAMAHGRLGRQDDARRWLNKAKDWLQLQPSPPEALVQFVREAEVALDESGAEPIEPPAPESPQESELAE